MKAIQSCGPQISVGSGEDTTYITTADDQGNWVSMIQSVHESFGCGIVAEGTGVILNNRTQGFNLTPGHPNELAPHKRPAHTLSPAMVFKNNAPWLALGTPGGMGQTQFLAQILSNVIDFGMDIQQAIEAPRWQSKGAGKVEIETRFPMKQSSIFKTPASRLRSPSLGTFAWVEPRGYCWIEMLAFFRRVPIRAATDTRLDIRIESAMAFCQEQRNKRGMYVRI